MTMHEPAFQYDVALSFAGEDRAYAEQAADACKARGLRVFYDRYEEAELWGKNLYDHLSEVYGSRARFCLMFISRHYAAKQWTTHERQAAQARAFREHQEYILPVRLDDTPLAGLPSTVGYVQGRDAPALADLVVRKLALLRVPASEAPAPAATLHFRSLLDPDVAPVLQALRAAAASGRPPDEVPGEVRWPAAVAATLEYFDEFRRSRPFALDVPLDVQADIGSFCDTAAPRMAEELLRGLRLIATSFAADEQRTTALARDYAAAKAVALVRDLKDHRLVGMKELAWLGDFENMARWHRGDLGAGLPYVFAARRDDALFWADADLEVEPGGRDLRVYVPAAAFLTGELGDLAEPEPLREGFWKYLGPQLVEAEVQGEGPYTRLLDDPARATLYVKGEWLIELDGFDLVSTINSGGREAAASVERLRRFARYRVRGLPEQERRIAPLLLRAHFGYLPGIQAVADELEAQMA